MSKLNDKPVNLYFFVSGEMFKYPATSFPPAGEVDIPIRYLYLSDAVELPRYISGDDVMSSCNERTLISESELGGWIEF